MFVQFLGEWDKRHYDAKGTMMTAKYSPYDVVGAVLAAFVVGSLGFYFSPVALALYVIVSNKRKKISAIVSSATFLAFTASTYLILEYVITKDGAWALLFVLVVAYFSSFYYYFKRWGSLFHVQDVTHGDSIVLLAAAATCTVVYARILALEVIVIPAAESATAAVAYNTVPASAAVVIWATASIMKLTK